MEFTIDGTHYNTHAGTEVAHWGDALPRSDPRHVFNVEAIARGGFEEWARLKEAQSDDPEGLN